MERVCREVLRACKALLHKFRLAPKDWPAVTECLQSVINHPPLTRLGLRDPAEPGVYRTPQEVFTSRKPTRPLLRTLPVAEYTELPGLTESRARQLIGIEATKAALENMHRDVAGRNASSRAKAVLRHNANTNVQNPHFEVGDFFLVRRAQKKGHKLHFVWRGPRRVMAVRSDWIFKVEDLPQGKKETVHCRRLVRYRCGLDGKDVDPILLRFAEQSETTYQDASALKDIREEKEGLQLLVEWEGLPDVFDLTWEPIEQFLEDLLGLLEDFLHTAAKRELKQKGLALAFPNEAN